MPPRRRPDELFLPGSYSNDQVVRRDRDPFADLPRSDSRELPDLPEEHEAIEPGTASIHGQGKELAAGSSGSRSQGVDQSVTQYRGNEDLLQAKLRIWDSFANKMLPPEETELMVKRLEKTGDARTRRTYIEGVAKQEIDPAAPVLRVGLVFLPGADKPQVTRREQTALQSGAPDQKNAMWRLNTAGTLLKHFDVDADLSIKETDQTYDVSKRAKDRMLREYVSTSKTRQLQQLSLRDRQGNAVTIDSEHVEIVEDLRGGNWDLEASLIEVDAGALFGLMTHYRHLTSRGGPDMSFDETRNLLDMMIEDARRLCVRSPVLFRMSTRTRIINSKNTRYGVNNGQYFMTISTSKGIQEIIRLSIGYYDALDPEGSSDKNQQFIRPRFLQMLTLLLSFLNDDDLQDIANMLEATYKIKADRKHLEMLFLKVIPLMSINSKIFLEALIPTVEGFPLQYPTQESSMSDIWDIFVQRILGQGYLLPGGVNSLGRNSKSWIVHWTEDGFKSTEIFRHLQYAGDRLRTINEISPMELHPEMSLKELTVHMVNGRQYVLDSRDLERITRMSQGVYTTVDSHEDGRTHRLEIDELYVNSELDAAITKLNAIIDQHNKWLASRRKLGRLLPSRKHLDFTMLNNYHGAGRMTRHVAMLDQSKLAVAYKNEGRKVRRTDVWREMGYTLRKVRVLLGDLEVRNLNLFASRSQEGQILTRELNSVNKLLDQADRQCHWIGVEEYLPEEPIVQVLYPSGDGIGEAPLWHDYTAKCLQRGGLHVDAKVAEVTSVDWRPDGLAEVSLAGHASTYLASPVGQGVIEPRDEIRKGDVATLAGRYLIVAERDGPEQELIVTNYLRVTSMQQAAPSNRGRLRAKPTEMRSEAVFV